MGPDIMTARQQMMTTGKLLGTMKTVILIQLQTRLMMTIK